MNKNPCLARLCKREAPRGLPMCLACWRRVPLDLQARVDATWRLYVEKGCLQCYLEALRAARDAVEIAERAS